METGEWGPRLDVSRFRWGRDTLAPGASRFEVYATIWWGKGCIAASKINTTAHLKHLSRLRMDSAIAKRENFVSTFNEINKWRQTRWSYLARVRGPYIQQRSPSAATLPYN